MATNTWDKFIEKMTLQDLERRGLQTRVVSLT